MQRADSGVVVWLTGLPASGKTTLAGRARDALIARAVPVCVLDSDEVRARLDPGRGFGADDRDRFYAMLAALSGLLAEQGLAVLVAATAHRRAYRERARQAAPRMVEVHVSTPAGECARRDPKGLYAAAARGDPAAATLPGVGAGYEPPERPDITAAGGHDADAVAAIVAAVVASAGGAAAEGASGGVRGGAAPGADTPGGA